MKTLNIVYLITHTKRLECNSPPYYYIGSKYKWKGEGSYYGSSSDPLLNSADPNDLDFKILAVLDSNCKITLLEMERQFQKEHNVISDLNYFNKCYANSEFWKEEVRIKATLKFQAKANSLSPEGILWKHVWAAIPRKPLSEEAKRTQQLKRKASLSKTLLCGKTVAQVAAERTHETLSRADENGVTGYQKQAEKLKVTLAQIGDDGLTFAQRRGKKKIKQTSVGGLLFNSYREALRELDISNRTLKGLRNGVIYKETYDKFLQKYGEDFVNQFELLAHTDKHSFDIEGIPFTNIPEAVKALGISKSTIDAYKRDRRVTKGIAEALARFNSVENE